MLLISSSNLTNPLTFLLLGCVSTPVSKQRPYASTVPTSCRDTPALLVYSVQDLGGCHLISHLERL
nr:MAG TPA: hypothetical protein [Caudoviricetes sp.]